MTGDATGGAREARRPRRCARALTGVDRVALTSAWHDLFPYRDAPRDRVGSNVHASLNVVEQQRATHERIGLEQRGAPEAAFELELEGCHCEALDVRDHVGSRRFRERAAHVAADDAGEERELVVAHDATAREPAARLAQDTALGDVEHRERPTLAAASAHLERGVEALEAEQLPEERGRDD